MKYILSFLCALIFGTTLIAENGCEIKIKLDYYSYDTLWFGTAFGKRAVPDFAAAIQHDGTFLLKTDKPLSHGMYAIIYKRTPSSSLQYFQCWLVDGQRNFSIETNISVPYVKPVIVGSPENVALFTYLRQLNVEDKRMDEAIERDRFLQTEQDFRTRVMVEEEIRQMQLDFIKNTPAGPTTQLVQQTLFPVPPTSSIKIGDWKKEANERWLYQRAHFFDNMDIGSPNFMRYLQWLDRTDFFLVNLPPADPDTLKTLIDLVFKKLEAYPEGYEYYQKYITNSLTKLSKFRNDEAYVYVVRNYVEKGKATWASENEVRNATNTANSMELMFEGKDAPPVTLYDRDNNPVPLYDIAGNLTLLIFYMPDCGHCKREIPEIAKMYETYKTKGLKVAAVCLKSGDDVPSCYQFTDTQNLPKDWYLLADPNRQANLISSFNVRSYPRLFLLDASKKIVYKQNGEMADWQLDAVLGRLLK